MPLDLSKYNVKPATDVPQPGTLNLDKYGVAPVSSSYQPEQPKPAPEVKGGFVGELLTGNTQRFGKTIGESIAAPKNAELYADSLKQHTEIQSNLLKMIANKKKLGQDTSKLEDALQHHIESTPKLENFTGDVINKSTEKVLGEAAGTGLEALSGGLLGGEAEALGAKSLSTTEKILKGAKIGATYGALGGATNALQDEKNAAGVLGSAAKSAAIGGVLGGGLGAVGGILSKRAATVGERATADIEKATGQILQGEAKDVQKGIKVLSSIDTSGVKTYDELSSRLNDKVTSLSEAQDKLLEASIKRTKLSALNAVSEIEGQKIRHNFVKDALKQLGDYYTKTNDIAGQVKIRNLISHSTKDGLTAKEVNDLAKLHGQVLSGFNANGELASGLTKQAAENTRAGLKSTVRMTGGKPSELLDRQISDTIKVRDLTTDVQSKVNALKQKIQPYTLGNKVGRLVFNMLDLVTLGGAKGLVSAALPRGVGYKTLNALDLEKALSGNLKILDKIDRLLSEAGSDASVLDKIQKILNQEMSLPTNPPKLQ